MLSLRHSNECKSSNWIESNGYSIKAEIKKEIEMINLKMELLIIRSIMNRIDSIFSLGVHFDE